MSGSWALQIAKLMGAELVIGSSTNDAGAASFGADLAVDTGDPAWADAVLSPRPAATASISWST